MPMFTASCGRTRMTAGPPPSRGLVLSVPAPTMAAGYSTGAVEANSAAPNGTGSRYLPKEIQALGPESRSHFLKQASFQYVIGPRMGSVSETLPPDGRAAKEGLPRITSTRAGETSSTLILLDCRRLAKGSSSSACEATCPPCSTPLSRAARPFPGIRRYARSRGRTELSRVTPRCSAASLTVRPRGFRQDSRITSPGWAGLCIVIFGSFRRSMVVDQIKVDHVLAVEGEDKPPIARHRNRPLSLALSLQG